MKAIDGFLNILTIGAVGGIIAIALKNKDGLAAFFTGINDLYTTATHPGG